MAVVSTIPKSLATLNHKATAAEADAWIKENSSWLEDIISQHNKLLTECEIAKYQAAYDGKLDSVDTRAKDRGDGTENKLQVNLAQLIIDTVVDYMMGKAPVWTVEDTEKEAATTESGEKKEAPLVTEYRKKLLKILKTKKAQRVLAEQLRQGSIAGYSPVICWINKKKQIVFEEYPVQEVAPVYSLDGELIYVIRYYEINSIGNDGSSISRKRVEIYDDKYITYGIMDEAGQGFQLDTDELDSADDLNLAEGNPYAHKAGRIPVSIFINGQAATYETRIKKAGTSDLGNGVFSLLEAYANGVSDKANLAEYLQDQYLALIGVDIDEQEVIKMRKARAIALKSKESDAKFIAQTQEDGAVEHYLDRMRDTILDMTMIPKLNDLQGATATEIKMKYAPLDIKAGKKEIYFIDAVYQLIYIITDLMNALNLLKNNEDADTYSVLSNAENLEGSDTLYNPEWVDITLNRNLPQNNKEIADIVAVLADKVPDAYLYELLWFIDDPVAALKEMKQQKEETAKNSLTALGYGGEFGNTGTEE